VDTCLRSDALGRFAVVIVVSHRALVHVKKNALSHPHAEKKNSPRSKIEETDTVLEAAVRSALRRLGFQSKPLLINASTPRRIAVALGCFYPAGVHMRWRTAAVGKAEICRKQGIVAATARTSYDATQSGTNLCLLSPSTQIPLSG
jgi:hypothetical protein